MVNYLRVTGVLDFPGGVPSSLVASGEQWDFPNAWAPTMWILIEGLRLNGQKEIALEITEKWVRKNFNMWRASGGKMYEKVGCFSTFSERDTSINIYFFSTMSSQPAIRLLAEEVNTRCRKASAGPTEYCWISLSRTVIS